MEDKTTDEKIEILNNTINELTELIKGKKSNLGRKKGQGKGRPGWTKENPLNSSISFVLREEDKDLFFKICDQLRKAPSEIARDLVLDFNKKNKKILKTQDTDIL